MTDKLCTIKGCTRPSRARSWCTTHYKRWKRHGDPNQAMTPQERSRIGHEAMRLKKLQRLEYEKLESEPK